MSRHPRGIVCKVLVFHLNVNGSIPNPTMIFLHGFYHKETALFSPLTGTERGMRVKKYKQIFLIIYFLKQIYTGYAGTKLTDRGVRKKQTLCLYNCVPAKSSSICFE
jgi:hypothetical protein